MTDPETIRVYDAKARTYADLVTRETPDQDLQAFIDAMPRGGVALDLGCGPGNSAAIMQKAGLRAEAMDASAEMVKLAREIYGIDARQARFDDLDGTDVYDGIWANFSLLHAPKSDMPRHLAAIKQALKPGGIFHIGTKLGQDSARDKIGRMYSYYSEAELKGLLETAGLTPRQTRRDKGTGLDGSVSDFIIILCDA